MEVLKSHFNDDGTLKDGNNPVGNILFDFCYEFVYPVTLSYNNGTEVTVQNFDSLIDVLISMTNDLYIDGIVFPFDVQLIENGTLVTRTIHTEDEFTTLIDGCSVGVDDGCNCSEEYAPVCVLVQEENGDGFVVEFPNMCFAICEGFTQDDIVDCDNDNPNSNFFDQMSDCFQLVYPFTIIDDSGVSHTINNADEFSTALFSTTFFEFVFPMSVTREVNGEMQTQVLNNMEEMILLFASCNTPECNCPAVEEPVCVETPSGVIVEYRNACFAACDGYTPNNFVTCN